VPPITPNKANSGARRPAPEDRVAPNEPNFRVFGRKMGRGHGMANKANWAGGAIGGHGPPYGMVGETSGAGNVKRTQFT